MDIQKFKTKVIINAPIDEVLRTIGAATSRHLTVYVKGDKVYEEFSPTSFSIDLIKAVSKNVGKDLVTYELVQSVNPDDESVVIAGERHWLYRNEDDNTLIYVVTWTDNVERHMKNVDQVKKEITDHGLEIVNAKCEITLTKGCP